MSKVSSVQFGGKVCIYISNSSFLIGECATGCFVLLGPGDSVGPLSDRYPEQLLDLNGEKPLLVTFPRVPMATRRDTTGSLGAPAQGKPAVADVTVTVRQKCQHTARISST